MKIGIIGSGISGLTCAYLLGKKYSISLFEKNDYLGGHTCTITLPDSKQMIDLGFIVFNKNTYPNFCKILERENIPFQETQMSFSVSDKVNHFEYNGHSLSSLYADKKNLRNINFYKMLFDIVRFNIIVKKNLRSQAFNDCTLQDFVEKYNFGNHFKNDYLFPMAQAIWSSPHDKVSQFTARFVFDFFYNHGLLNTLTRPQWYVIKNGSNSYIPHLIKHCQERVFLNHKIEKIERNSKSVSIHTQNQTHHFDKIIIATHSDQALKLLDTPTNEEQEILGSIPYHNNDICLHTDDSILPHNKKCWASWNFSKNNLGQCQLSYYMNLLQNFSSNTNYIVSVNQSAQIESSKIIKKITFSHPVFTREAVIAQKKLSLINGKKNTYFCGAYWHHGFHEDGVKSALTTCDTLGSQL